MNRASKKISLLIISVLAISLAAPSVKADNIVFSEKGSLSRKLFNDTKFISLNKKIIECETGKFVFKYEMMQGIYEPSYHNIIGKVGDKCLYKSNYNCGTEKCFANCELSEETINLLEQRFNNHLLLSVKGKIEGEDILTGSDLDIKIFESFNKDCKITVN